MRSSYVEHDRVAIGFEGDEGCTKQEFKDDCDINLVLRRFYKTGVLTHARQHGGQYGDFTKAVDYHTALNMVHEAEDMFMSLPASLRAEFDNDPGLFLDFATDEENTEALREFGLLPPEVPKIRLGDEKANKVAHKAPEPKKAPEAPEGAPGGEKKGSESD